MYHTPPETQGGFGEVRGGRGGEEGEGGRWGEEERMRVDII